MTGKLMRVGTTYLPVQHIDQATAWYVHKLGAVLNYKDKEKAIINLANQSFFLVKAASEETANFIAYNGDERFTMTFEVDGLDALENLHSELAAQDVLTGDIENRGHAGRNFIFQDLDGNLFDVWSEISPDFKKRYGRED
ncbi:VOC family protein [Cytobacillus purgationiresistens]|uniref:Catechol 2,3-dioxygenase-like lactoylglutathione lyase family enzyme n=1 Tax=Cytobacillus purgationiresistens TaxID=863449 RepID=A0ABU0AJC7_9BACI|nr:VOC family protein [Cytobacillus purgationiresistens]MDQ0271374.1 catechol 2,3-dioxygenase-like lactoylglutathione lyase family enzyme [Cytobacillus purgationiresistens]